MRTWIEYIMNHSPANEDLILWFEEVRFSLTNKIIKESKRGNTTQVNQLAIELAVYDSIREKFQSEFRELKSQSTFDQKRE